jgi:PAS domain S-box-containing protein
LRKRKKHKGCFRLGGRSVSPDRSVSLPQDRSPTFWAALEAYNNLPAPARSNALKGLGIVVSDGAVHGILTKSHFVIPGKTRFACQRCGECCRYARKVAQLTYEPCLFLTPDNDCAKHDSRYLVCRWFPFWIYNDPRLGKLLTIKPYCSGYGQGSLVDYEEVQARILGLAASEAEEDDGAFVIHEVLLIPGRKDWAFPSKSNVDALMFLIKQEARKSANEQSAGRPLERTGEVHYAHHYTSGLLGSIHSPLFTVNEQGLVTDVNEAACQLFKRDHAVLVGKAFAPLFANPDRLSACLSSCLVHGKETASPQRLRFPDESTTPVLLNGLTFRDRSDGLVHGALFSVNSVPAVVWSEVNQSQNYARGLLEASLDALMVIDRDGAITDVNETVVSISGRSRQALVGMPFKDLFVCQDKAQQGVELTFQKGSVRNYELTLLASDGQEIPVSFNATVYKDSEGVVQGVFAAARDIRERLKMTRELEEAKHYARGLIECCIDLMVTINRDGIITDANRAAGSLSGRAVDAIIGAAFKDFFDDPDRAQAGVDETFAKGEVRNYDLNLFSQAHSSTTPVSFNATIYRDAEGAIQGVFAIARAKA